jgi:hypothetical protein
MYWRKVSSQIRFKNPMETEGFIVIQAQIISPDEIKPADWHKLCEREVVIHKQQQTEIL